MSISEMHVAWQHCALQRVGAVKAWVSGSFTNFFAEQQKDLMFFSQIQQGDMLYDIPWEIKTTACSLSCKVLF